MAVADTSLVVSDLLQRPNNALNAARPAAGLPQLQSATFGTAVMGYGDLFVAALLGGAARGRRGARAGSCAAPRLPRCSRGAFDLLFFLVDELPATVPVALALIILVLARRRGPLRRRAAPAPATAPRTEMAAR